MLTPFHLAIHVQDLEAARAFYGGVMGCAEGRSAPTWVDFDFFGHQLSLHKGTPFAHAATGRVGDKLVPMPHLGLVLQLDDWRALADAWRQLADLKTDELIERRHARLNSYGRFTDTKADAKGRRG